MIEDDLITGGLWIWDGNIKSSSELEEVSKFVLELPKWILFLVISFRSLFEVCSLYFYKLYWIQMLFDNCYNESKAVIF